MSRVPLILCLFALGGAGLSAVLYFEIGNSKKLLEVQLASATARSTKLESDLAAANEQNGALKARTTQLDSELLTAEAKLTAASSRADQLGADLTKAKANAVLYEQTNRALADEVNSLKQDLADTRASNASPEAVAAYKSTIAELEHQLANARNGAALTAGSGGSTAVFSSRPGRASILTVGPGNAFVVLNFGAERGAQVGQKLQVNQGTNIVATVLISDVRAHFSVAQVQPDSLRGVLQKGDLAVLVR